MRKAEGADTRNNRTGPEDVSRYRLPRDMLRILLRKVNHERCMITEALLMQHLGLEITFDVTMKH